MDYHAELALIKQHFEKLLAMHDPMTATDWHPSDAQRIAYIHFANRVLDGFARVRNLERRKLLENAQSQQYVPESILGYIHDQVEPKVSALRATLDRLDPEGADIRLIIDEFEQAEGSQNAKGTFELGIEQVRDLIERNPDRDFGLAPDVACEVIDSPLILFDPDAWLERVNELAPVRTHKKDVLLPSHVRLRIEELNRAYVFGCWLSVLALARAILEYAILDNIHKLGVQANWPPLSGNPKGRAKKLSELIDELKPHVPALTDRMERLRDFGNDYMHPSKSKTSKESLFQSKSAAQDAMKIVVEVVEGLYLLKSLN
jgi:hypothetical protein